MTNSQQVNPRGTVELCPVCDRPVGNDPHQYHCNGRNCTGTR